jgi:hypothetical protein
MVGTMGKQVRTWITGHKVEIITFGNSKYTFDKSVTIFTWL